MERKTKQRDAILQTIEKEGRPLSPQEILAKAQKTVPGLGIATVYRTVKELLESNKVSGVDVFGETQRYEIKGKHHHHHFWCRVCDKLFEVEGCTGKLNIPLPRGFRSELHEILFKGLCSDCS